MRHSVASIPEPSGSVVANPCDELPLRVKDLTVPVERALEAGELYPFLPNAPRIASLGAELIEPLRVSHGHVFDRSPTTCSKSLVGMSDAAPRVRYRTDAT